jgi:hypothetical protein
VADHVHHDAAAAWFGSVADVFATTPMTQGTLDQGLASAHADVTALVAP